MSRSDYYEHLILEAYKELDDEDIGIEHRCEHAQAILARFEEWDDTECEDCGGGVHLPSANLRADGVAWYCPTCDREKFVPNTPGQPPR